MIGPAGADAVHRSGGPDDMLLGALLAATKRVRAAGSPIGKVSLNLMRLNLTKNGNKF